MGSERMPAAKGGDKAKAKGVAKAITKGVKTVQKKIRTNIRFHLPKTLAKPREGKYPRKYRASPNRLDRYAILKYPLTTESAMKKIEENNTLVFIVDVRASMCRSRRPSRRCTTSTPRRSTPSSGPTARRRPTFASPRTTMPWMLLTRSASSKLVADLGLSFASVHMSVRVADTLLHTVQ